MSFPSTPRNNQLVEVNGIIYIYDQATGTWTRSSITSANVITTDTANVTSVINSTSTTTGAIRVAGGAGIAGNVFAGAVYTDSYFYANGSPLAAGTGSTGFTGSAGVQGIMGFTGSTGAAGISGYSGSSAGVFTATAAGSITAGRGVILNANATVSAVGTVTTAFSGGTPNQFGTNWQYTNPSIAYDSVNNRVYLAYGDAFSGTLKVVVGTPSGTTTTWGTPADSSIAIYSNTNINCAFDTATGKLVVVYSTSNGAATNAVVCSFVAGPSVTFGTPVQVYAGLTYQTKMVYDASGKTVIVYKYLSASVYNFAAIVGTVSGTTISFGSPTTFYTAASSSYDSKFDVTYNTTGSNIVVAYVDGATGSAVIGTVSGTAISFGSAAIFRNAATNTAYGALSITYDYGSARVIVGYTDASNTGYVSAGSISGTTITFGTAATITYVGSATTANLLTLAYDPTANRTFLGVYRSSDNTQWLQDLIVNDLTVSATYPTAQVSVDLSTAYGSLYYNNSIYLGGSVNKVMYLFVRTASSGAAYSVLVTGYQITTNAGGWFGLSAGSYTNGQLATITVLGGVNTNQSGLTPNATYYIGATGTISSSAPGYGKVGVALSSTSLLVTNQTVVGYTGSAGYLGSFGYTGSTGSTGFTGSRGTTGFTGSIGSTGFTGSGGTGFTGSIGYFGSFGYTGSLGYTGSGATGFTGSAGTQGIIGYTGSAGTGGGGGTGYTGSAGNDARTLATGIRVDSFTGNAFTANGSILTFGLSVAPYSVNETIVVIDGVVQQRSTYTVSGTSLTLQEPLLNLEKLEVTTIAYGATNFVTRNYTGNAVATTYTVTSGTTADGIFVSLNGVIQRPAIDYTVSGSTLTFSEAPANGDIITIREIPSGSVGGNAIYSRSTQTATAGQTTFAVAYNVGYIQVYLNGVFLNTVDYTANNGSTVVLTDAAADGDLLDFITFNVVPVTQVPNATYNSTSITANMAITAGYSAVSVGPINIANGVSITIADGQKWVIL